jgi:hypothetical protein
MTGRASHRLGPENGGAPVNHCGHLAMLALTGEVTQTSSTVPLRTDRPMRNWTGPSRACPVRSRVWERSSPAAQCRVATILTAHLVYGPLCTPH